MRQVEVYRKKTRQCNKGERDNGGKQDNRRGQQRKTTKEHDWEAWVHMKNKGEM